MSLFQTIYRWAAWVRSWVDPLPVFIPGKFTGQPAVIWRGPRDWRTIEWDDPLVFTRSTGEMIAVGTMDTDLASIPSVLWSIPGMDPAYYGPAAMVHDWLFIQHHKGDNRFTLEEANAILMEAIETLIQSGASPRTKWTELDKYLIWEGLQTPRCREVWEGLEPVVS